VKISIPTFRGRAPRVSDRALSDGYATIADSPRLLSGDLESWRERTQAALLPKGAAINSIYRLASRTGDQTPYWLHWTPAELAVGAANVDVALGPEPGDLDVATYFAGTSLGPRYTTKFLATDESQRGVGVPVGAYPYESRALRINPPTAVPTIVQTLPVEAANQVTYTASGASVAPFQYVRTGGPYGGISVSTDPDPSAPANQLEPPRIFVNWRNGGGALVLWNEAYDLANANAISFSINLDTNPPEGSGNSSEGDMSVVLFAADSGVGARIALNYKSAERARYIDTAGTNVATNFQAVGGGNLVINGNLPIKVVVTGTKNAAPMGSAVVTWTLNIELREYGTNTLLSTMNGVTATAAGDLIGVIGTSGTSGNNTIGYFNDVSLTTTLAPDAQPVPTFTSYVYTLVNDLGWESAPSPVSAVVTVDNGITNTVTIPAQTEPDIAAIRLYRAGIGTAENDFLFVAEIAPPYPATYADSTLSSALGEALVTEDFDAPPDNLRGLLALPGGSLVGFDGNQLCFSEPEYPYAWPQKYRLPTDYNVVAIAAINSAVVVLTEAFIYLASGNAPGDYAMEKLEYPQGCVSKRSVAYLSGAGVLYASPDGLYSVTGSGPPRNTTELLFARREWQALNPSSLIGVAHDDRYFGFYRRTDGSRGGFILDFRQPGGFGLIDIPDHATAVYADPITDTLYFTEEGPTLDLQIAPTSINLGQSATLTWTSENVSSLVASGDWSGGRADDGSQSVTPATAGTLTYTLTGASAIGPITDSVTLTVVNPNPTVQFAATSFTPAWDGASNYSVNLTRSGDLSAARTVTFRYADEGINVAAPGTPTELATATARLSGVFNSVNAATGGIGIVTVSLPSGLGTISALLPSSAPQVGVRFRNDVAFPESNSVVELRGPLETTATGRLSGRSRPATAPQNDKFLARAMFGATSIGRSQGFAGGSITMNLRTNFTRSTYSAVNSGAQASDFAPGIPEVFVFAASVNVGRTTDPATNWLPNGNTAAQTYGYSQSLQDGGQWLFKPLAAGNKLEVAGIDKLELFAGGVGQFGYGTSGAGPSRALRFVVAADAAAGGAISVGSGWTLGGALVDSLGRAVTLGYQTVNLEFQDVGLNGEFTPIPAASNSVWTRASVADADRSASIAEALIVSGDRLTFNSGGSVRNVVSGIATVGVDGSFSIAKPTSQPGDGIVVVAVAMAPRRKVNGLLVFTNLTLGTPSTSEITLLPVNP
jgi:hypothetical protein